MEPNNIITLVFSIISLVGTLYMFFWDSKKQCARLKVSISKILRNHIAKSDKKLNIIAPQEEDENDQENADEDAFDDDHIKNWGRSSKYDDVEDIEIDKFNKIVDFVYFHLNDKFSNLDAINIFGRIRWTIWIWIMRIMVWGLKRSLPNYSQENIKYIKGTNIFEDNNFNSIAFIKPSLKFNEEELRRILDNLMFVGFIRGTRMLMTEFKFYFNIDVTFPAFTINNSIELENNALASTLIKQMYNIKSIQCKYKFVSKSDEELNLLYFAKHHIQELESYVLETSVEKMLRDGIEDMSYASSLVHQYYYMDSIKLECKKHGYDFLIPWKQIIVNEGSNNYSFTKYTGYRNTNHFTKNNDSIIFYIKDDNEKLSHSDDEINKKIFKPEEFEIGLYENVPVERKEYNKKFVVFRDLINVADLYENYDDSEDANAYENQSYFDMKLHDARVLIGPIYKGTEDNTAKKEYVPE